MARCWSGWRSGPRRCRRDRLARPAVARARLGRPRPRRVRSPTCCTRSSATPTTVRRTTLRQRLVGCPGRGTGTCTGGTGTSESATRRIGDADLPAGHSPGRGRQRGRRGASCRWSRRRWSSRSPRWSSGSGRPRTSCCRRPRWPTRGCWRPTRLTSPTPELWDLAESLRAAHRSDADAGRGAVRAAALRVHLRLRRDHRRDHGRRGATRCVAGSARTSRTSCSPSAGSPACRPGTSPGTCSASRAAATPGSRCWCRTGRRARALAFDPTNGCRAGGRHLPVAVGRDYADVAPTSGVYTGPARGQLSWTKRAGVTAVGRQARRPARPVAAAASTGRLIRAASARGLRDVAGGDRGAASAGHVPVRHQRERRHLLLLVRAAAVCRGPGPGTTPGSAAAASTTPPPRKYACGSVKFAAIVNSRPSAIACCSKTASASSSPPSASPRTCIAAARDRLHPRQRVVRVAAQPVGQQVLHDPGQRGDALRVTDEAAVADRQRLVLGEQPVHRDLHVPELAGHPGRALHDPAASPPRRRRGRCRRSRPPRTAARPPRRSAGGARTARPRWRRWCRRPAARAGLQRAADVEAAPLRLVEVRRALGRDHAVGAGRPGRVQADRDAPRRAAARCCASTPSNASAQRLDGRRPAPPAPGSGSRTGRRRGTGRSRRARSRWCGAADVEADDHTRDD